MHRVLKQDHIVILDPKLIKIQKSIPRYPVVFLFTQSKTKQHQPELTEPYYFWLAHIEKIGKSIVILSFRITFNVSLFSSIMIVSHIFTQDALVSGACLDNLEQNFLPCLAMH